MKLIIAVISILITSACSSQVVIKLPFAKGKKFEVTTDVTLKSSTEIMGKETEMKTQRHSVQIIDAAGVSNGETKFEISTTKLQVAMETNGQEISYDSDKKDNPMIMTESFGEETTKKRNFRADSNGNLRGVNIRVPNSVVNLDVLTGNLEEGNIPLFQTFLVGKIISVGAVWLDSLVSTHDKVKSRISGSYKIKKIENGTAFVFFTGVQKSEGVQQNMGQEFNITTDFGINAEIRLNVGTGLITYCAVTYDGQMYIDTGGILASVKQVIERVTATKVF